MSIKEYRDQLYDNIIARRKQLRRAEKEKYGITGMPDLHIGNHFAANKAPSLVALCLAFECRTRAFCSHANISNLSN